MSKGKIRDLIICIVALLILGLVLTTNVFASDIEDILGNNTNTENEFAPIENRNTNSNTNTNANVTPANNTVNNVANNTNVNKANTNANANNSAIPYAGVDYSVVAVIVVCGASAVYAYKKIRDYKSL